MNMDVLMLICTSSLLGARGRRGRVKKVGAAFVMTVAEAGRGDLRRSLSAVVRLSRRAEKGPGVSARQVGACRDSTASIRDV